MRIALPGLVLVLSLAGCGLEEKNHGVIRLGLIAPTETVIPPLRDASLSFVKVAETAVEEINANGGIYGQELVLVVRHSTFDPPNDAFGAGVVNVIKELDDIGVVGAIGPVTSDTTGAAWETAKELEFPLIAPSSTAASLSEVPDGGYLFRDVGSDAVQAQVLAYSITQLFDEPQECVHVLHQAGSYGKGFARSFACEFQRLGLTAKGCEEVNCAEDDPAEQKSCLEFPTGLVDPETKDTGPVVDVINQLLALEPCDPADPDALRNVVLISLDDVVDIRNVWDAMTPRPKIRWFFTDGARTPGFLDGAPGSVEGMVGTAPTNPILGDAYEELDEAYARRYPGENIAQLVFTPQVWDAVYLFAAGLALQSQQNPDQELGGLALAQAIRDVSRGGQGGGIILHAGQWSDLLAAVKAGAPVDFDGASGPVDFDECGQTISLYEFWRLVNDGSGKLTFRPEKIFDTPQELARFETQDTNCEPF